MPDYLKDKEAVLARVTLETGKSRAELERAVQEKMAKFSGLLNESGAAFMVARELGVALEEAPAAVGGGAVVVEKEKPVSLASLKEGMDRVLVEARVKHVFAEKAFEKGGKKGKLCSLLLEDGSGEMRLTVWNDDVDKLRALHVEKGAKMRFRNGYVKNYNDKPQLSLGYRGEMQVVEAASKAAVTELASLREGMDNVDVVARVARVYGERGFDRDGKKGSVLNFALVDASGMARAAAWNELVPAVKTLERGDLVKVEGAYTKPGLNGVELNLGWKARVVVEPSGYALPALRELRGEAFAKKEIVQAVAGEHLELRGAVKEVAGNRFYFEVREGGAVGGEAEWGEGAAEKNRGEPALRAMAAIELEDDSGSIRVVCFGRAAEKLMGFSRMEWRRKVETESAERMFEELQEKLRGKPVAVWGRVQENKMTAALECVAEDVEVAGSDSAHGRVK